MDRPYRQVLRLQRWAWAVWWLLRCVV